MPLLPEPTECSPDQTITCRAAFAITKDERVSDIASWLIGKPLTVLILVLVAVVARWLLFRVIDGRSPGSPRPLCRSAAACAPGPWDPC